MFPIWCIELYWLTGALYEISGYMGCKLKSHRSFFYFLKFLSSPANPPSNWNSRKLSRTKRKVFKRTEMRFSSWVFARFLFEFLVELFEYLWIFFAGLRKGIKKIWGFQRISVSPLCYYSILHYLTLLGIFSRDNWI